MKTQIKRGAIALFVMLSMLASLSLAPMALADPADPASVLVIFTSLYTEQGTIDEAIDGRYYLSGVPGEALTPPEVTPKAGYEFDKWVMTDLTTGVSADVSLPTVYPEHTSMCVAYWKHASTGLETDKTAVRSDENKWDVTLRFNRADLVAAPTSGTVEDADIMLVVDVSATTDVNVSKTALLYFLDTLEESDLIGTVRVGVARFGESAASYQVLTQEDARPALVTVSTDGVIDTAAFDAVETAVTNGVSPVANVRGDYAQAIGQSDTFLYADNPSVAKYMVLLSAGDPTNRVTAAAAATRFKAGCPGNPGRLIGVCLKPNNAVGDLPTLQNAGFYQSAGGESLRMLLGEAATDIFFPVQEGVIVDVLGDAFALVTATEAFNPETDVSVSGGTISYNQATKTFTWIFDEDVAAGELKYSVELENPDAWKNIVATTNKSALFDFINKDGVEEEITFPVPKALYGVGTLTVKYEGIAAADNPPADATYGPQPNYDGRTKQYASFTFDKPKEDIEYYVWEHAYLSGTVVDPETFETIVYDNLNVTEALKNGTGLFTNVSGTQSSILVPAGDLTLTYTYSDEESQVTVRFALASGETHGTLHGRDGTDDALTQTVARHTPMSTLTEKLDINPDAGYEAVWTPALPDTARISETYVLSFVEIEGMWVDVVFAVGLGGKLKLTDGTYLEGDATQAYHVLKDASWDAILPTPEAEEGYQGIGWSPTLPATTQEGSYKYLFEEVEEMWVDIAFTAGPNGLISMPGTLPDTATVLDDRTLLYHVMRGSVWADAITAPVPLATADPGYVFAGWRPMLPAGTTVLNESAVYTAVFEPGEPTFSFRGTPRDSVSINAEPYQLKFATNIQDVRFSSSDTSIADVDSNGLVTLTHRLQGSIILTAFTVNPDNTKNILATFVLTVKR